MNIKQAKEEIQNAMMAYFTKDEFGEYEIPIEKQRPVFLMGPPGIGKTAIMEQIAQELGVGLLSYSMTHHTRQSALGLPFISHKTYGGKEYEISEYTMSEIISAVYEMKENTGVEEGILFLDEINCVSETLAPAMLQFLQFKVFGRHKVPDGWIVVTAGNPPEYNNSVREFDIVTWDRLKRINVEPDYTVWKEYAVNKGVHPAVTTYLDIKKDDFYLVESTVGEKNFVTARGWDDLSSMIKLYEKRNITVTERLVSQYLQQDKIAKNFAVYYDLFRKYKSDYQVKEILEGTASASITDRAKAAKFDERLALIGLLLDGIFSRIGEFSIEENMMKQLVVRLREVSASAAKGSEDVLKSIERMIAAEKKIATNKAETGGLSAKDKKVSNMLIAALYELLAEAKKSDADTGKAAFDVVKTAYNKKVKAMKKHADAISKNMDNMFRFAEDAFAEGQEMVILVTELTINADCALFISRYGCERYFAHNKELLFYERHKEIIAEIEEMEL